MMLIYKNELKRAFKRKYVIAFVLIAIVVQGFLQFGKFKYLDNIENRNFFHTSESAKVDHYLYFRQYATFGITLMFVPSNFSILFNDSTFELLVSKFNIGDLFDIDLPKKGKELFDDNSPFLNFMGVSMLLIFYFGILYGKDTAIKTDYLKFLSSRSGTKKALLIIMLIRLILLNATFLFIIVINISVLLLNNINLFQASLIPFFWGIFLITSFSFVIGFFLGTVKINFKRNTAFFVIYVGSAIMLALLLNFFTKIDAGDIKSVFEVDIENLNAVMIEEEVMLKKHGPLALHKPPTKDIKKDARQSLLNYNKKIRENLVSLKHKLESKIKNRKFIASFFPTLFYFSICEDASTNSYDRFIDFFTFSENRKQEFVKFCVDKIYPLPDPKKKETPAQGNKSTGNNHDSQAGQEGKSSQVDQPGQPTQPNQNTQPVLPEIENFIKDNEDLFFAESKLPRNFRLGSLLSILWIAGFLVIAFVRALKQIKGEPGNIRDGVVKMKSDKFNYLLTADQGLKNQVYNSLTGDGYTTIKMIMDDKALEQEDIIYVYETERFLEDVDQGCLYKELLGKEMPRGVKPWESLIQYAADTKKFLFLDDFFKGMDMDDMDEFIKKIKEKRINVLYVGGEFFQSCYLDVESIYCKKDLSIPGVAERIRAIKKRQAKNQ